MYTFFVFKEFNYIGDFLPVSFLVQFCTPTSQTSGVSILHPLALYQTSDLLQCFTLSNRCHMEHFLDRRQYSHKHCHNDLFICVLQVPAIILQ